MSDARTAILERIKKSLADVPAVETSADVSVVRDYLTIDPSTREEIIEQFVERVTEYRAKVHRVGAGELGQAITSACSLRGVKKLVVPVDIPEEWIPSDIMILRDELLTNEQLNNSDGVLTGCALGIAQTGTIVLDRGTYQGRRALTLLPDYHLCVVFEKQVVGMVPEAVEALRVVAGAQGRAMTWISGPSATSDIELNRVEGVHGPRTLEVLVVGSD
jgi:L-lactate dehydrogenase complex protein LldG